jgi:O-antigen/teichoic acid export membrane protein
MSEIFLRKYKYLSLSIASSIASKIASALITFFAMPLILVRLGVDNFAIYSMILALTGCFAMLNLGIAPYLIVNVSELLLNKNVKNKKIISSSAFYLSLFYSFIACLSFITLISFIDLTYIFPEKYSPFFRSIYLSVLMLILFNFIHSLLNVFESIQIAYKELHLYNLYYASGSLIVLCLLYFNYNLSFMQVIVLSLLPIYLTRLLNLVVFLKKHLYLLPSLSFFNFKDSLEILKTSVSLSFAGGISNFLSHIFPILIIGKISSAATTV